MISSLKSLAERTAKEIERAIQDRVAEFGAAIMFTEGAMEARILKALQEATAELVEGRCWLVEMTKANGGPCWWCGEGGDRAGYWTTDPLQAIRFLRKEDAFKFILSQHLMVGEATEHIFVAAKCPGVCSGCERTKDHLDDTLREHHQDGSDCEHRPDLVARYSPNAKETT